jgi:Uma2 family endonuclease
MSSRVLATMQLRELADEAAIMYPLTVEQYHRMIDQGILPEGEPYELLNGQLIRKDRSGTGEDPMTVGHGHAWVVAELADLNSRFRRLGCHLRTQLPLSLPPTDEPEPDGAVVIGTNRDYLGRHPVAADVICVIEVADSSLQRDRTIKLRLYASAGIPCYIIVNLLERIVEVYTVPVSGRGRVPRYGKPEILRIGEVLKIPAARGKYVSLQVEKLLP